MVFEGSMGNDGCFVSRSNCGEVEEEGFEEFECGSGAGVSEFDSGAEPVRKVVRERTC